MFLIRFWQYVTVTILSERFVRDTNSSGFHLKRSWNHDKLDGVNSLHW